MAEPRFAEQGVGSGDLEIVWLHGWGQTGQAFGPLATALKDLGHHRLIDLPGFGATPMLPEGAGSADYARALSAHLGPKSGRRLVIGHSFGVRVALQWLAAEPGAADGLIAIAGAGLKRKRSWRWRLKARGLKALGRLAALGGPKTLAAFRQRFGSADYKAAGPLRATLVSVVNEDLSAQAAQVPCPALLFYGAQDDATPPDLGERLAALMPDARLKILPHLGHLDILTRGAHPVAHHIRSFVEERLPGHG